MVAIKDFGMPSCCFNCDMQIDGYSAGYYCAITNQELNDNYTLEHRHPNCPLVETGEPTLAKWIKVRGMNEQCSNCKKYFPLSAFNVSPFNINYCSNCGAKMEE